MKSVREFISKRLPDGIGMAASGVLMSMFPFQNEVEATVFKGFAGVLIMSGILVIAAYAVVCANKD